MAIRKVKVLRNDVQNGGTSGLEELDAVLNEGYSITDKYEFTQNGGGMNSGVSFVVFICHKREIRITPPAFSFSGDAVQSHDDIAQFIKQAFKDDSLHTSDTLESTEQSEDYDANPIECLNLSIRPFNALKRRQINTISDLRELIYRDPEFKSLSNVGKTIGAEINMKLENYERSH